MNSREDNLVTQTGGFRLEKAIRTANERGEPALAAFLTAGFPARDGFADIVRRIASQADIIELGVPFSDPMADGVTIQDSSRQALADGVNLTWILELVAGPATRETTAGPPVHPHVPAEYAVHAFHGVLLDVVDPDPTARLLTDVMGFEHLGEYGGRLRFRGDEHEVGSIVDLRSTGSSSTLQMGRGSVHHVAFRARDDDEQQSWRETITGAGIPVTTVQDRCYFHSIYFREPGGVLFEIATDTPGFGIDESEEELGRKLQLPPWFEARREEIEARLPRLVLPDERS